ncbi:MAG: hypothetical protein AB9869_22335 [Verrucomicrobiia bacterium]
MKALNQLRPRWVPVTLILAGVAWSGTAQPVIYQATGTREEIQPVIEQFKHDIIYGPGGDTQNPPIVLGSFKVATFDDAAAGSVQTVRASWLQSGGLNFINYVGANTPYLSAESGAPLFGDINPNYPKWLQAYSGSSVMAIEPTLQSNKPLIVNDPGWLAHATAFGAVFVDVDFAGEAAFKFWTDFPYDQGPAFEVMPSPGDGNFSFLGVILDYSPEPGSGLAPGVVVKLPDLLLDPNLASEDPAHDIAALDDVIMGTAAIVPEPSAFHLLLIASFVACCATGRRWINGRGRV